MTTSPDSVTYPQTVSEVVGASEGADWSSTYRPVNPWTGLFGYATDLDTYEFRIAADWRHPAWTEGATFTGPVTFGTTDFQRVQIFPQGLSTSTTGSPQTMWVRRVGSESTAAGPLDKFVSQSSWVLTDTNAAAGVRFTNVVATSSGASVDPGEVWGFISTMGTQASTLSRNHVAGYFQALRNGLPGAGVGVPVEGLVIEARDKTEADTVTAGKMRTLELDLFANGADGYVGVGREVMPIVLGKHNPAGTSPTITSLIGVYGVSGDNVSLTRGLGFYNSLAFTQSLFDSRDAAQGGSANALWLKSGQRIALDGDSTTLGTASTNYIFHGSSAINVSGTLVANSLGAAPISLSSGIVSVPASQSLSVRLQTAGQTITFGAPSAGLGNALTITPQSGGNTQQSASPNTVSVGNVLSVPYFQSAVGQSTDITGSSTYIPRMNIVATVIGTNTNVGSTGPAQLRIAGTYSASMPNGIYNMIGVYENASGFDGALTGVKVQLATTGTSSLSSGSFGLISTEFVAIGNHNLGGVSTNFGTTNFGVGVLFGANPRALNKVGTYYSGTVGQETGAAMYAAASSNIFVVQQLVLEDLHATHGIQRDAMLVLGAQAQVVVGTREGIEVGGRDYHWPIDTNGYVMAAHIPASWVTRPSVAAGGVDFNDVSFSGTGEWGGGFAFRGRGVSLIPSTGNGGALRAGFGSFSSSATGASLSIDQDQMTGTPAVNTGGTGWVQDQIAGDVYGNIVQVNVAAGVVTSIKAVINRGFVPTGTGATTGVAFTCKNVSSLSVGTGLTLNLTWTPQTRLTIQPTTGQTIYMPALQASTSYANDAAASAGGVAVGQLYRNGSVIQIRIV